MATHNYAQDLSIEIKKQNSSLKPIYNSALIRAEADIVMILNAFILECSKGTLNPLSNPQASAKLAIQSYFLKTTFGPNELGSKVDLTKGMVLGSKCRYFTKRQAMTLMKQDLMLFDPDSSKYPELKAAITRKANKAKVVQLPNFAAEVATGIEQFMMDALNPLKPSPLLMYNVKNSKTYAKKILNKAIVAVNKLPDPKGSGNLSNKLQESIAGVEEERTASVPNLEAATTAALAANKGLEITPEIEPYTTYMSQSGDSGGATLAKLYFASSRDHFPPDFDSDLTGKRPDDIHYLRIGDFISSIPPESISVTTVNSSSKITSMRQANSTPLNNGYEHKIIRIPLTIYGMQEINGKPVLASTGGYYYMDGIRSLLAQFKKTPFLPIVNEHINSVLEVNNVALSDITIQTVEGFPEMMTVELTMFEFNTQCYTGAPDELFQYTIDWDLFRWFYQDEMGDDVGKLKKIEGNHLHQELKLSLLDEDLLLGMNNPSSKNFNIYDLKNYKEYDLNTYPISIKSVTGAFQNVLPTVQLNGLNSPVYQYNGCTDGKLAITIETQSKAFCTLIGSINDYVNRVTRNYNHIHGIGFCFVNNEVANMMGVGHCIIDAIDIATLIDFPGVFRVTIELTSFDSSRKAKNGLFGFNPFNVPNLPNDISSLAVGGKEAEQVIQYLISQTIPMNAQGLETKIMQDMFAENVLGQVDLYADLELPTYEQTDKAIALINASRAKAKLEKLPYAKYPREEGTGPYVDPDFYIMYPLAWDKLPADLMDGSKVASKVFKQKDVIKQDIKGFCVGDKTDAFGDTANTDIKKLREESYSRNCLTKEYIGKPAVDIIPLQDDVYTITEELQSKPTFQAGSYGNPYTTARSLKDAEAMKGKAKTKNTTTVTKNPIESLNKLLVQDFNLERAFVDMLQFNKRGRLLRAFPTYVFCIVDESGPVLDGRRMWNNYYVVTDVIEIHTHASRDTGITTLNAKINNTFGNLSKAQYQIDWMKKASNFFTREFGMWFGTPKLTVEALINRLQLFSSINLKDGARLHVRMGYGNSVKQMPIVFNGRITEIMTGEVIEIIGQSDGLELHNAIVEANSPNASNGIMKLGEEPSDILKNILQNRQNIMAHAFHDCFEANQFGIEHFGMYMFGKNGSYIPGRVDIMSQDSTHKSFTDNRTGASIFENTFLKNGYKPSESAVYPHNFNDYDLVKNIYIADLKMIPKWSHIYNSGSGIGFDGELNTKFTIYGKSAWDVGQILASVMPEFVCQPVFHQFESRLFYGNPTWLYKYRWTLAKDGSKVKAVEEAKTFMQIHCVNSTTDIIHNTIKTTTSNIATNVVATYKVQGKVNSTGTLFADKKIHTDLQKNKIVQTDNHQNIFSNILDMIVCSEDRVRKQAVRMGVSTLIDDNKRRYEGSLLILGDTAIKPCDRVEVSDSISKLNGAIEVREVSHHMSGDMGFVTDIIPDMVVFNNVDGMSRKREFAMRAGLTVGAIALTSKLQFIGALSLKAKGVAMYDKAKGSKAGKLMAATYKKTIESAKIITATDEAVDTIKAVGGIAKTVDKIKDGAKAGRAAIAAAAGSVSFGFGAVVWWVASEIVMETVAGAIIDFVSYNNCIKTMPLMHKGYPYISGVKGSTGLIVGGNETEEDIFKSEDKRIEWLVESLQYMKETDYMFVPGTTTTWGNKELENPTQPLSKR